MSHSHRFPIVLLAVATGACNNVAGGLGGPFDAAMAPDTPAPVADVGAGEDATLPGDVAGTVDILTDAPADLTGELPTGDGAADSPADDQLSRYHKFLQDSQDLFDGRQTECFGTSPAVFRDLHSPSYSQTLDEQRRDRRLARSMRLGLLTFDDAAAATCLHTLGAAACQQIAAIDALGVGIASAAAAPECSAILAGQVPNGGPCLQDLDCGPSLVCGSTFPDSCSFCLPMPAPLQLGESCSDSPAVCPAGAICAPDDGRLDQVCKPAPPNDESTPCDAFKPPCKQGLFCATNDPYPPNGLAKGICRPLQLGIPCTGPADCFDQYVCVGATAGQGGTCQVGKGADQPCTIFDYQDQFQPPPAQPIIHRFSDCAPGFACLDRDGQGRKCAVGSPPGGVCGIVDLQSLDCLDGHCYGAHDDITGICRPLNVTGTPCQSSNECANGDFCLPPSAGQPTVCLPDPKSGPPSIGQHCAASNYVSEECEDGAFCGPPPGFQGDDDTFPVTSGVCAPVKKIGESCREHLDSCEPLATCINSVCTPCR